MNQIKLEGVLVAVSSLKAKDRYGRNDVWIMFGTGNGWEDFQKAYDYAAIDLGIEDDHEDALFPMREDSQEVLEMATGLEFNTEADRILKITTKKLSQLDVDKDIDVGDVVDIEFEIYPYDFVSELGHKVRGISLQLRSMKKS